MGKVVNEKIFEKDNRIVHYMKDNFGIDYTGEVDEYKDALVDDIMVNLKIDVMDNFISLKLIKLVSIKAFLLSKAQEMDINELIYKIDRVMDMSGGGLSRKRDGILYDDNLKKFFEVANIELNGEELKDNKRRAKVELKDGVYDFNTIVETELF